MVNKVPAGLYFLAVLLISRQARTDITASEALPAVELVRRLGPDSRDYAVALGVHRVG